MSKEIKKINKCYGKFADQADTSVFIIFSDGKSTIRKFYKFKKSGIKYIKHDYGYYKIAWNALKDTYDFQKLDDYDFKHYFEADSDNIKKPAKVVKKEVENKKPTKVEKDKKVLKPGYVEYDRHVLHSKYNIIKSCINRNIPVYLSGEAGSGKNFILQKIAEEMEMDFYFTNSVQQEYKITGFIDAGGTYHETEFYKAFTEGGMFFLDELDASVPEVLVLLNAAIANKYFEFPNGRVDAHKDFRVVAAGNTVGSGADELYTGRMVLDQATLDRFAIITFTYERGIELSIARGNAWLVDFIRESRKIAVSKGIRATFSYRAIMMVRDLEKEEIPLKEILQIAVFKGMTKDTLNCFTEYYVDNKYVDALRELQRAA